MRELTDTEKELVKALIENASPDSGRKLGDVLIKVYPIEYIEKNTKDNSFYNKTVKICHKSEEGLEAKLYEAFSLFIMLIERRYIVAKEFIEGTIIGEKSPYAYLSGNQHTIQRYFNYYEIDLWTLLNSQYSISNSLLDYVNHGFKTLEERHHAKEIQIALDSAKESRCATKLAFFSLIVAVAFGIYQVMSSQKIDPKQINAIETAIRDNHIEEPMKVEIGDTILTKQIENNRDTISCHQPTNLQKK